MSNYNNNQGPTQPRQWQPQGGQQGYQQQQRPPQQGGYNRNANQAPKAERRTGKSTFSKPLREPAICRVDGHIIPAGTVGVRFDYDNRDQNDKALTECPEHFAEFKKRMGWDDTPPPWTQQQQQPQQQAEQTVQNGFGGQGQWAPNDGNGQF